MLLQLPLFRGGGGGGLGGSAGVLPVWGRLGGSVGSEPRLIGALGGTLPSSRGCRSVLLIRTCRCQAACSFAWFLLHILNAEQDKHSHSKAKHKD